MIEQIINEYKNLNSNEFIFLENDKGETAQLKKEFGGAFKFGDVSQIPEKTHLLKVVISFKPIAIYKKS